MVRNGETQAEALRNGLIAFIFPDHRSPITDHRSPITDHLLFCPQKEYFLPHVEIAVFGIILQAIRKRA